MNIAYQRERKRVCPTPLRPRTYAWAALFPQKHRVASGPDSPADSVTIQRYIVSATRVICVCKEIRFTGV